MILTKPSYQILSFTPDPIKLIERAGRTCYRSEDLITDESADKFVEMVRKRGHHSVIEHAGMTVRFVCDRGITHELVRHRLAAYSQESTRYVCYAKDKFGNQATFVIPPWCKIEPGRYELQYSVPGYWNLCKNDREWFDAMWFTEKSYLRMIKEGWKAQQARSVLPNSLKTEIVMTANFREWLHVFKLRCSKAAHPQMRESMIPLAMECAQKWPAVFGEFSDVEDYRTS